MTISVNRRKTLQRGFGRQVAEIVGSDQYYVSKVLNDPDKHNGRKAKLIKAAAAQLKEHLAALKTSFHKDSSPVNP
jgi:hypothetical protein